MCFGALFKLSVIPPHPLTSQIHIEQALPFPPPVPSHPSVHLALPLSLPPPSLIMTSTPTIPNPPASDPFLLSVLPSPYLAALECQSMSRKITVIHCGFISYFLHLLALTEIWISPTDPASVAAFLETPFFFPTLLPCKT